MAVSHAPALPRKSPSPPRVRNPDRPKLASDPAREREANDRRRAPLADVIIALPTQVAEERVNPIVMIDAR